MDATYYNNTGNTQLATCGHCGAVVHVAYIGLHSTSHRSAA